MSNSVSSLSDIVVSSTKVSGVSSNSSESNKASERHENIECGSCEFGNPDLEEISKVKKKDISGASSKVEADPTRSRFREVLQRQMGEEPKQARKNEQKNKDNDVAAESVEKESESCNVRCFGGITGLLKNIRTGEQSGVRQEKATLGDAIDDKQHKGLEGENNQKAEKIQQINAEFGKGIEGSAVESQSLKKADKTGFVPQEQARVVKGLVSGESVGAKENGLEAKIRATTDSSEQKAEVKIKTDGENPVQNMHNRQNYEGQKVHAEEKYEVIEPTKVQTMHTTRVGGEEQKEAGVVPLRAELRIRTARKDDAPVGEQDATQDKQRLFSNTDIVEASHLRTHLNNAAGVNSLTLNNRNASGISETNQNSQVSANSLNVSMGGIRSVGQQIIEHIGENMRGINQEIRIMLNPPELGRVRIHFQQQGEDIIGWLQVEKAQTRYEVERELPQIIASLQQNGVFVRRVEVTQNSYNEAGEHKNNTTDDYHGTGQGELGEHKFNEGGQGTDEQTRATRQVLTSEGQSYSKKESYKIDDDSINVYV